MFEWAQGYAIQSLHLVCEQRQIFMYKIRSRTHLEAATIASLPDQALDVVPALQLLLKMWSLIHYAKPQCNLRCVPKQNSSPVPDERQMVLTRCYQGRQIRAHEHCLFARPLRGSLVLCRPLSEAIYRSNNIVAPYGL